MNRYPGFFLAIASAVMHMAVAGTATAGFASPESVVRNVYGYYGNGAPELSGGLPRDEDTARRFFDAGLLSAWLAAKPGSYDFFAQSPKWKLSGIKLNIVRKQFDRTYVAADFDNRGKPVSLNFILVNGPGGWVIYDVESTHDSLRLFLQQLRN